MWQFPFTYKPVKHKINQDLITKIELNQENCIDMKIQNYWIKLKAKNKNITKKLTGFTVKYNNK